MQITQNNGPFHSNPYGMLMDGRSYSSGNYRFGFGGQEKDQDINSNGNVYTAEFWEYDSRISRRWNVDPAEGKHPDLSAYSVFINNPLLFNDPEGDDPDPKKATRSMKKYGRKFDRELRRQNRQGTFTTLEAVHRRVENRYNGKSWMWVKNVIDGDKSSHKSAHMSYYHAGELYKENNSNASTPIRTTTPVTSTSTLTFNSQGSVVNPDGWSTTMWREYSITNNGILSISINTSSPGWNFDIIQSDGSTTPVQNFTDLYGPNPGVIQIDNWISTSTNLNTTRTFAVNISSGNLIYINTNFPGATPNSNGGSNPTTSSVTFTTTTNITRTRPFIFIARAYNIVDSKTLKHVHRRLTNKVKDELNEEKIRNNL